MVAKWVLMTLVGLLLASWASRVVVSRITLLARGTRIPPFVLGLTVLAVGTDLPEIANSIIASISQHGDMNVGDSIGSAVTQVTLVAGILPFACGAFVVSRRQVTLTGIATIAAILCGVVILTDGYFSRSDGVLLVVMWFVGSVAVSRFSTPPSRSSAKLSDMAVTGRKWAHATIAILALAVVGVGTVGVLSGLVGLSRHFQLPEYLITFFVASIGTSLPELFVDVTALRRGTGDLAVGDLFGSSFVDSTLSVGIGPIFAATPVTAAIVIRGGLLAAAVITVVTLLFWVKTRHDWRSGLILLLIYAATYSLLLVQA